MRDSIILVARAKYGVDDDLLQYIYKSARSSTDFSYLLLCFRLITSQGSLEVWRFLGLLVPHTTSDLNARQLSRQILGRITYLGAKGFYVWFRQPPRSLFATYHTSLAALTEALRHVFPWNSEIHNNDDPYRILLTASLCADVNSFSPSDLQSLSQLSDRPDVELPHLCEVIWRIRESASGDYNPVLFETSTTILSGRLLPWRKTVQDSTVPPKLLLWSATVHIGLHQFSGKELVTIGELAYELGDEPIVQFLASLKKAGTGGPSRSPGV